MLNKYVSVVDYLMGRATLESLSPDMVGNINTIVPKTNELLERFGEYRGITSGIRTKTDQIRIYEQKNAARKTQGLPELKVPMASKHISCQAVDLEDANGAFKKWLATPIGLKALEEIGLWQEHPSDTPTWVHIQCVPPISGSRVFHP